MTDRNRFIARVAAAFVVLIAFPLAIFWRTHKTAPADTQAVTLVTNSPKLGAAAQAPAPATSAVRHLPCGMRCLQELKFGNASSPAYAPCVEACKGKVP
jgi:hypothetical protein